MARPRREKKPVRSDDAGSGDSDSATSSSDARKSESGDDAVTASESDGSGADAGKAPIMTKAASKAKAKSRKSVTRAREAKPVQNIPAKSKRPARSPVAPRAPTRARSAGTRRTSAHHAERGNGHRAAYARRLAATPATPNGTGPKLWQGARELSNVYGSALRLGEGACACRHGHKGCPVHNGERGGPFDTPERLQQISSKIFMVRERILQKPGKHFVYSRFPTTARAVVCAMTQGDTPSHRLLQLRGPRNVSPKARAAWGHAEASRLADEVAKGARPGLLTLFPVNGAALSDTARANYRNNIVAVWKAAPQNVRGQAAMVLVGTGGDLQGVDLADTRYVHQLEPLASVAAEQQLEGRSVRSRSMCGYPATEESQRVTHFRYIFEEGVDTSSGDTAARGRALRDLVRIVEEDRTLRRAMLMLTESLRGQTGGGATTDEAERELQGILRERQATRRAAREVTVTLLGDGAVDAFEREHMVSAEQILPGLYLKLVHAQFPHETDDIVRRLGEGEDDAPAKPSVLESIDRRVIRYAQDVGRPLQMLHRLMRELAYDRSALALSRGDTDTS